MSKIAEVRALVRQIVALFLLGLVVNGCDRQPDLLQMPTTDLSMVEPAVRNRIAAAKAEFDIRTRSKTSAADAARAYGDLGMVYQAQDLTAPAEVAYLNAHRLDPRDKRWPYLLGHLYADQGKVFEATRYFKKARDIDPGYAATKIYLGQMYLSNGDLEKARLIFEEAKDDKGSKAAALAGQGKVALTAGQYQEAVGRLEEALRISPGASRLRQPLAMAYRGLGNTEKAQANLAKFAIDGQEPAFPDPIVDAMSEKLVVSHLLLRRGQKLAKEGRFDLSEGAFRAAVASNPNSAEAFANLGISLANLGRTSEAQNNLIESLRLDDDSAVAHLSLGVIYDRQGEDAAAIAQYQSALKHDPNNIQAAVYFADAVMRTGSSLDAAELYRRALSKEPKSSRIALSLAFALIKAADHVEARKVLETALSQQPQSAEVINALARLLATAPAAEVRDGPRALTMVKSLLEANSSVEVGQTYGMALAETGDFSKAAEIQQDIISTYERSKTPVDKSFLIHNLAAYRQSQSVRQGWSAQDPVFWPRSPAAALVRK